MMKFRNFWNLKEFLKKVHYSSYFEGLFITWKNCFERTKHNISFFSFQRSWNGWIEVRLHFVRYFFTSVFLLSFSTLIIFFPERRVSDIIHASFQIELQGYKRLRKIDTNSRSFKKVKFPLPKYLFCKTRKFDLLYLLLKVLQRTPVMRLLWRRYFFSTKCNILSWNNE